MIIDYIFIVILGVLLLISFLIFLDNERMYKDIIENPLPPPMTIEQWEEYQVMCEARVFSVCPDCKEDWDDCKCERINDDL